jgi:hypothetical protein
MFALSRLEWIALAVALLLLPGFSWGQAAGGASASAPSLFDRLDRDKDGYLTIEELSGDEANSRNWIAIDRDRDGRISRSEFGLVGIERGKPAASAAAGASAAPKKPE